MPQGLNIAMLMDAWFPIVGGGQVHVQKLAEQLVKNHGCRIDLYVRSLKDEHGEKWTKDESFFGGRFRVIRVGPCTKFHEFKGRFGWIGRVQGAVKRAHAKEPYDVIHAHAFLAGFPAKALRRKLGIPLVYTVHGTSLFTRGWGLQSMIERLLLCKLKYDCEISVAHNFLGLPNVNRNIMVIPNGVDTDAFDRIKAVPSSMFTLLFVGRFDPIKGLHHLIEALPTDVRLNVVGSGREAVRLKRLARGKNVDFLGTLAGDDLIRAYKSAHLFVLPSLSEGQPLTLLEAWAAKQPVLVTSVGDNPRMVRERHNGFLVEPGNPVALGKAIQDARDRFERDPAEWMAMGEAGYALVKKEFTWEKMADRTMEVYRSVLRTPFTNRE